MPVTLYFSGDQVGTMEAVDDDGNGNTILTIGETPFLPTDLISVTFSDDSFDSSGEFKQFGDIFIESISVTRNGFTHQLGVNSGGSKVKESGGGENKEQGDTFFTSNDSIYPASSGPFSSIPEDQYAFLSEGSVVAGGQVTIPRVTPGGNGNFDVEDSLDNPFICFVAGTKILTDSGEVAVERLRVGDLVETLDAGPQPIRWIGSRSLARPSPNQWPVRISANALGPGYPARTVELSPQHRVLLEGPAIELLFGDNQVLAAAKSLINGTAISAARPAAVLEYYHFCFDRHHVILANGLASESLFPGNEARQTLDLAAITELNEIFPGFAGGLQDAELSTARPILRHFEAQLALKMMLFGADDRTTIDLAA